MQDKEFPAYSRKLFSVKCKGCVLFVKIIISNREIIQALENNKKNIYLCRDEIRS